VRAPKTDGMIFGVVTFIVHLPHRRARHSPAFEGRSCGSGRCKQSLPPSQFSPQHHPPITYHRTTQQHLSSSLIAHIVDASIAMMAFPIITLNHQKLDDVFSLEAAKEARSRASSASQVSCIFCHYVNADITKASHNNHNYVATRSGPSLFHSAPRKP
jgi:hypothetical protein